MATTDARSGFRLPWSSDRQADNDPVTEVAPAEDAASSAAATTADAGATTTTTSAATDPAPTDVAPTDVAPTDVPSADAAVDPAADPWAGAGASSESATLPDQATPTTPAPQPTRKPNKFLADLTKAMQAAAEEARGHSLQQLQADAKTHIETIHGRSATEAASLRRQADDDVAAVREWSKAEIARVREETEQRITDRKSRLETEIEEHAAVIEREIDAVQRMVSAFEDQMAAFFQRLLAEGDPTRFATMAENLPEPPSFDEISAMIGLPAEPTHADPAVTADATHQAAAEAQSAETAQDEETVEPVAEATAEPTTDQTAIAELAGADVPEAAPLDVAARNDDGTTVAGPSPNDAGESVLEPIATDDSPVAGAETSDSGSSAEVSSPTDGTSDADATSDADGGSDPRSGLDWPGASADPQETSSDSSDVSSDSTDGPAETSFQAVDGDEEVDREAAFAAIQAAAEAAASAEVAADAAARAEAVADVAIEIMGSPEGEDGEGDPRMAALGLPPDYDAAEAEALAAADGTNPDAEEIPVIGDDALAARLAGLVPEKGEETAGDTASTQVIVVGLISVASIASFKRHLGRLAGVRSVGVSSGPDGEFVFAVTHSTDSVLRDAIPSLPSFQARVTNASDGVVHVTAHDPEADG